MSSLAISVEDVSKVYRLGVINHGMLYRDVQSSWARFRGRPDPNAPLFSFGPNAARFQGGRFNALENVSFNVEKGETVGIVGRNGAGKSTLLKILSRISSPTTGCARLRGRMATLLEVGTGFHPELTGRENVFLNGAILGMTGAEIRARFDAIVDFSEIEQFIDTPVKRYSSGMYVKLAFAVAAHLEPEILIVDEVLAVGDLNFQKKCFGRMAEIGKEGRTVLFVSHNLTSVARLCRTSLLLEDGKLIEQGPTSDVIAKYVKRSGGLMENDTRFDEPLTPEARGKVRRIRVSDAEGNAKGVVELTKQFEILVEYEVVQPMRGLILSIEIHSDDLGLAVISLTDGELDLSRMGDRAPGRYQAKILVPELLLNTGAYHVRAGMTQNRGIVDAAEGAIFEVNDYVGIMGPFGFDRKSAITSIRLPWSLQRTSGPDVEAI